MQSFNFYSLSALLVLTLIASICESADSPTTTSTMATATSNDNASGNMQKDEPKSEPATRPPESDAANRSTMPPLIHSTIKPESPMSNDTKTKTDPIGTTGGAANANKKTDKKNGASRGSPEFLVTSFIVLIISALYV